jgi:hypothetical protein
MGFNHWFANKKSGEKTFTPDFEQDSQNNARKRDRRRRRHAHFASNQAAYNAFGRKNGALEEKRLSEVVRDLTLHEAFRKALEEEESSDIELEIPSIEAAQIRRAYRAD